MRINWIVWVPITLGRMRFPWDCEHWLSGSWSCKIGFGHCPQSQKGLGTFVALSIFPWLSRVTGTQWTQSSSDEKGWKQLKCSTGANRPSWENIFWCCGRNSLLLPLPKLPLTPIRGVPAQVWSTASSKLKERDWSKPKWASRELTIALHCSRPQQIMQYSQPWKETKNNFSGK